MIASRLFTMVYRRPDNGCYNAVDCHVEAGHGDRAAIIYDSSITDSQQTISYADLQSRVAHMAGVLKLIRLAMATA